MKILHIANFSLFKNESVFYSIDRKISNGLIRNGHFVADFSYRDLAKYKAPLKIKKFGIKKMHESIFKTIDNVEPDLILLGHSELIDSHTTKAIKEKYPNIKLAMWWVDWLKNLSSIQSKINYLDVLFTTTGIDAIDDKLFNNNLKIVYIPNMCDSSIESYKAFEKSIFQQDLLFAGRVDLYREDFILKLKNSLDKNIIFNTFGTSKDNLLLGNEFLKTIGNSKFALNLSRDHDTSLYSSDRIIQLMANGTCVFSKSIPNSDILFNNSEIIFFDTINECKEKIEYYYNDDNKRKEIAYNGWKKAHDSFNSTRVTKFMLEVVFNDTLSENYEWKDQVKKVKNEKNINS
jgi:hypothetical protein